MRHRIARVVGLLLIPAHLVRGAEPPAEPAAAPPAEPELTPDQRLDRLEKMVLEQQQVIDQLKKDKYLDTKLSLTDGLRVQSTDGNVEIHVGGRFQEHLRVVDDRPDGPRTQTNSFYIRAARIQVDGTFYKDYGFMVQGDFPSSTTGPTPTLQLAYVEWKRFPEMRWMFGQFKAPASQERLTSRLFSDFVEDSPLTRFVPGYDIGIQAQGKLVEGILNYQLAVVNGRSHLDNQGRSRSDDNDDKEFVGRVTVSPFVNLKQWLLKGLRFGAYGSITHVDAVPITGATTTTFDVSTPELGVTFFDPGATGGIQLEGKRTRVGGEVSYAFGPAAVRAEYLLRHDEMESAAEDENVPTTAWYVTFTWILTGEDKVVEARIVPKNPLFQGGIGALELALRVSGAEIGDEIEDLGVSVVGQTRRVTCYTGGLNWWLTRNLRVSADVVYEDYHDEIDFGSGHEEDSLLGMLARFQIDF